MVAGFARGGRRLETFASLIRENNRDPHTTTVRSRWLMHRHFGINLLAPGVKGSEQLIAYNLLGARVPFTVPLSD